MGVFFGFGLYVDEGYELDDARSKKLLELIPNDDKDCFLDSWEDAKEEFDAPEKFFPEWAENYYDAFGMVAAPVLADIINQREFGGKQIFYGEEGCLYAAPHFPKDREEKDSIPTVEELRDAIDKYFIPIFGEYEDNNFPRYEYFEEL